MTGSSTHSPCREASPLRIYDLSLPIDPTSGDPFAPRIEYQDHDAGVQVLARMFGIPPEEVPDGKGSASEIIQAKTHSGTHMDAPFHYFPTSGGAPARTIDQIPLEWCFAPGVVLDCTQVPAGTEITPADLEQALARLARIDYTLQPGNIVLIRTDTDKHYYTKAYKLRQPGMGRDATLWLIQRGIRVMGIDAWAWDVPLEAQGERYRREGRKDPSILWAAHRVGKDHEYFHMEQLGGLDKLPRPHGFTAAVFPIKIPHGSAGWVRAVAIFPDLP